MVEKLGSQELGEKEIFQILLHHCISISNKHTFEPILSTSIKALDLGALNKSKKHEEQQGGMGCKEKGVSWHKLLDHWARISQEWMTWCRSCYEGWANRKGTKREAVTKLAWVPEVRIRSSTLAKGVKFQK